MLTIVLVLAAILVALPLSYEWVISFFGPIVVYAIWKSIETIALVQLGLAAACLVLWPVAKITEKLCARWPDEMRVVAIVVLVLGSLAALASGVGPGSSGPQTVPTYPDLWDLRP